MVHNNFYDIEVKQLAFIINALMQKNSELVDELENLNEIKNNLEEVNYKFIEISKRTKCKHPPYILSEILGISSYKIVKIAEILNIIDNDDFFLRIPRVNKEKPKKYETIVLFSDFGFMKIVKEIKEVIKNRNYNKKIHNYIKDDISKLSTLFLSFEGFSSEEFSSIGESSLKEIWDNKEEDDAWSHL